MLGPVGYPADMPKSFLYELTGCMGFPVAENPTQAMIEPPSPTWG